MDAGRSGNGYGPNPISFSEIEAWCRVKAMGLSPDEVSIIRAMDDAYLSAWSERQAGKSGKPKMPELTETAFDALF